MQKNFGSLRQGHLPPSVDQMSTYHSLLKGEDQLESGCTVTLVLISVIVMRVNDSKFQRPELCSKYPILHEY